MVLADNPDEIVVRGVALEYEASIGTFEPGASLILAPPKLAALPQKGDSTPHPGWLLESAEGISHPLKPGITKIGRARDSQIWLDSEKVSRNHAEIHIDGETITLTDLGSTNGTFVNEKKLSVKHPHALDPGDEIRFGDRKYLLKNEMQ